MESVRITGNAKERKKQTCIQQRLCVFQLCLHPPHPLNKNLQKYEGADDPVSAPPPIKKGAELGFLHAALKSDISNNIIEDDDDCQSDQNKSQSRV